MPPQNTQSDESTEPIPPVNTVVQPQGSQNTDTSPVDVDSGGYTPVQPPAPTPPVPDQATPSSGPKKSMLPKLILFVVVLLLIAGAAAGAYLFGKHQNKPAPTAAAEADIIVPDGATVAEECIDGLGKQYALPKDIPYGPIYNVNNGKVIGVEYMVGGDEFTKDPAKFTNLQGFNHKFDHVNLDYLPNGHAGLIGTHFHIDLFTISKEAASQIKCASTTDMNGMQMQH